MKRMLIFSLLGPPLGLVTGFYVLAPIMNWLAGDPTAVGLGQLVLLPLAYVMGLVPAFLAGAFDYALARRQVRMRPLWTGLAGFILSFAPLAGAIVAGYLAAPLVLIWGLLGVLPGAVCSWLSGPSGGGRAPL